MDSTDNEIAAVLHLRRATASGLRVSPIATRIGHQETIKFHDYPFYKSEIAIKKHDAEKLQSIATDPASYRIKGPPKLCGGYHPDWCVEWQDGDNVYRALLCFGCGEVILSWSDGSEYCDIADGSQTELQAILEPYQKNRPKEDANK
jgi:hypothetical protein